MNLGLASARVLVTAGASGIGLAIAREFVNEGAQVHVCDVDTRALDELSYKRSRRNVVATATSRMRVRSRACSTTSGTPRRA